MLFDISMKINLALVMMRLLHNDVLLYLFHELEVFFVVFFTNWCCRSVLSVINFSVLYSIFKEVLNINGLIVTCI